MSLEAIQKVVNDLVKTAQSRPLSSQLLNDNSAPRVINAFEEESAEQKDCTYCRAPFDALLPTTNTKYSLQLNEEQALTVTDTVTGQELLAVPVAYCPYCGRRLDEYEF